MNLKEAEKMGYKLFKQYHLYGWKIKFTSIDYVALCVPDKRQIKLDKKDVLEHSERYTKDSILHEIAHVLCPPIISRCPKKCPCRKGTNCHDKYWKQTAKILGAVPTQDGLIE